MPRQLKLRRKRSACGPSSESYFNIGLANYYLKQYREAADAYRQAIRLDPYNAADAYYALGLVYRDWGRADEEIQAYKQAIRLRPDYTSAYEDWAAGIFVRKSMPRRSRAFKQLSNLKPADATALNSLGETYLEMGHSMTRWNSSDRQCG